MRRLPRRRPTMAYLLCGSFIVQSYFALPKLFDRRSFGLQLRPSAFWLFRSACRLLYLEEHMRETGRASGQPLVRLSVELDLSFVMGRVSRALLRACQALIATHPRLLVEWRFAG